MSPPLLYLDQNYLSGIAKRKPAFVELEPLLRAAVDAGAVEVAESPVHLRESAPRPDLGLVELLRELSHGRRLPAPGVESRRARRRLERCIARSSQPGIHQLARPSSCMSAGTSTMRTTVASTRIAVAIPIPSSLRKISPLVTKARKTTTMIAAAAVMTRAVLARPSETARAVSRCPRYSSRTRESRNTS